MSEQLADFSITKINLKKKDRHPDWREESLFTHEMILYVEYPTESTAKVLQPIT